MTILDFANLFDSPYSVEQLLQHKKELMESDLASEETINGLFSQLEQEKSTIFDRQTFTRSLITYICTTGDSVPFIMKTFSILLQKDGCSNEDINRIMKMAYKQARDTREKELIKAAQERKRLREEQRRKEEYLQKLEASLDMSKTAVSYDTARFLIRNEVTYEDLENTPNIRLVSQKEIDPILHNYRIDIDEVRENVSIADVVGYSHNGENDLLKSFPKFFDSNKNDGYYQRSLSMLDLTTDNAMEKLSPSFIEEPMKLVDAPGGRFTIGGNGMHRYSILRSLYCIEMMKAKGDKAREEEIYQKYKIPALVSKIDYVKTYANYILTSLKVASWVAKERDSDFQATGRTKIELPNHETIFLTNEELLVYVGNAIRNSKGSQALDRIFMNASESFLNFLSIVVPEMVGVTVKNLENENEKTI